MKMGEDRNKRIIIVVDESGEEHEYEVAFGTHLTVSEGSQVKPGDAFNEGSRNPHDILRILGETALQNYLVQEVQKVYRSQGVDINDKHIEVIVRAMLRKVKIVEGGDTLLLPGQVVEARRSPRQTRRSRLRARTCDRQQGAAGRHQSVARDRIVLVGGKLPRNHPRPDRRSDQGQTRSAAWSQGKRHHRQADPGRNRDVALSQRR